MQGFQYSRPIDVRYADIDMMGHVNNAKYLTFIEHARSDYFLKACNWDWTKLGMVLARTEIDYKRPILLHSRPVVWVRTTRLGQTSFTQENQIAEAGQPKQIYATAISTLVHVDYTTGRPLPITEQIKKAIRQYEEGLD
jgi:acyl-CoA thioester hydrolase